jgi:hypothetical protein
LAAAGMTIEDARTLNALFASGTMNQFIQALGSVDTEDASIAHALTSLPIMLDTMMLAAGRRAGVEESELDQRVRRQLRLPADASALGTKEMASVRRALTRWLNPVQ